jgi:hypothetical protein
MDKAADKARVEAERIEKAAEKAAQKARVEAALPNTAG